MPRQNISYVQALQKEKTTEENIISKILPALENVMKKCVSELIGNIYQPQASISTPRIPKVHEIMATRSRTGSEASNVSKRKTTSPVEESDISDTSQQSSDPQHHKNPSRRGERKGRPKKDIGGPSNSKKEPSKTEKTSSPIKNWDNSLVQQLKPPDGFSQKPDLSQTKT